MPINTSEKRIQPSHPSGVDTLSMISSPGPIARPAGLRLAGVKPKKKQEIQKSILWRVMADTFFRKFGLEMKLSRTAIVNISIRNRENFNKKLANMWGEKFEIRTKKSTCRFLWKLIFSPHVNPSQFLTRVWISSQIEN